MLGENANRTGHCFFQPRRCSIRMRKSRFVTLISQSRKRRVIANKSDFIYRSSQLRYLNATADSPELSWFDRSQARIGTSINLSVPNCGIHPLAIWERRAQCPPLTPRLVFSPRAPRSSVRCEYCEGQANERVDTIVRASHLHLQTLPVVMD